MTRSVEQEPSFQEEHFQQAVLEFAAIAGWRRAHFRPARTKHGWRTPVAADGAGFPDLILVRPGRLVVAELKSNRAYGKRGKPSVEQQAWLDAFGSVDGVEVHVWKPADWDLIVRTLTGKHVTHGRHCSCSSCAQEDWTRITSPCGMHGPDCPPAYDPY